MDNFGDRMKSYEARETGRTFMPGLPIYARIDGRSFSRFTHGMERPYDVLLSGIMVAVTRSLVEETGAVCGYTQSDEISLAWYTDDPKTELFFGGKIQKLVSICSALATVYFNILAVKHWPERCGRLAPVFDCRAFNLPNLSEAANTFLWREQDATKNAISMAARHYYSHKALQDKSGSEMQEMLFAKGINFNDYPAFFKRGTFLQRRKVMRFMSADELVRIPEKYRPTEPIERTDIVPLDAPPFTKVTNRVDVIFAGADPKIVELVSCP